MACADGPSLTKEEIGLLREILPHLSIEQLDDGQGGTTRTIRFSEVNLQIVNGLGATNGNPGCPFCGTGTVNGLGNLIVGYNEQHTLTWGRASWLSSWVAGEHSVAQERLARNSG